MDPIYDNALNDFSGVKTTTFRRNGKRKSE